MKKKILALILCAMMAATAVVGGTLAYFTDTEGATNVMTVGNVSIVQDETNEKGEAFQDNQKLYPYTGDGDGMKDENLMNTASEYYTGRVMDTADNWISKIVTVKNDGSEDAYVRTLFAFQNLSDGTIAADPVTGDLAWRTKHGLHYDLNQYIASVYFPKKADGSYVTYTAGDKTYIVGEYFYKMDNGNGGYDSLLNPEERSHPSLESVALEWYVDNDKAALYKDYEILVVSQAVQTKGFTDVNENGVICDDALNTAFGALAEADQETLAKWFACAAETPVTPAP